MRLTQWSKDETEVPFRFSFNQEIDPRKDGMSSNHPNECPEALYPSERWRNPC